MSIFGLTSDQLLILAGLGLLLVIILITLRLALKLTVTFLKIGCLVILVILGVVITAMLFS